MTIRSPAVILYDSVGNAMEVKDGVAIPATTQGPLVHGSDGTNARRLSMDTAGRAKVDLDRWFGAATPTVGQKAMAASLPVTLASDQSAISVTLGAATGNGAVAEFVKNGGSESMVVDGTTPVPFVFPADGSSDITLQSIRMVFSSAFFNFDGATFGKGGGALGVGIALAVIANNGAFNATVITLKVNEDFERLLDLAVNQSGSTDTLAGTLPFGGNIVLKAGTADKVTVTIQDDLTAGNRGISYLTGTVYGIKV